LLTQSTGKIVNKHSNLGTMASNNNDETPAEPHTDKPQSLAARMKSYEAHFDQTLPLDKPIILRLDGHGFSRFTSHFARPFDERIHSSMISTCADLLHFFPRATVAYTQSDEITLVFPEGVQSFNERVQKLSSLSASYCSVKFNKHLADALKSMPEPEVKGDVEQVLGTAHFDARFFPVPSMAEALNNLIWRCRNDAVRNSVSAFARTMYSTKEMNGKKTQELVNMMLEEKGVRFEEAVPKWAIEGCLIKREQYEHEGVNLKTGEVEKTFRSRTRVDERGVREFGDEGLKLVTERYW
jgi:tRNA(His) guanylyltransferase